MKVYVDGELPKECFDCPCFRNDVEICCGLDDGTKDYHNFVEDSTCPLATTQSLKQQVREEVVEEIKEKIKNIKENILTYYGKNQDIYNGIINDMDYGQIYGLNKLLRILDQVKGENNERN